MAEAKQAPVTLDASLRATKEIVAAVQKLQQQQEDVDRQQSKDLKALAQTKEKIKAYEQDYAKAVEGLDRELKEHSSTREKLEKAEREHMNTRNALQAEKDNVASMRLQMEALKVEMEAQRKAFLVNVNWASRCTELKVKFDEKAVDLDQLLEEHMKSQAALANALKAQDEHKSKFQMHTEAMDHIREDLDRTTQQLTQKPQLTDEVKAQLEEWNNFKAEAAAEELNAKKGRSKAMGVLERQLAGGEAGLKSSSFSAWAKFTVDEKQRKRSKDQAMKRAMKQIANEGTALVSQAFTAWRKDVEAIRRAAMEAANKKLAAAEAANGGRAAEARKKALAQLEKQFVGQDKALTKAAFGAWAEGQALRKKKDANLQKGARMIANSQNALICEIWKVWNVETEKTRITKKKKEAGTQRAMRLIADSGKALCLAVWVAWLGWTKKLREEKKKKAAGNEKALRMMANSDKTLLNICYDSWANIRTDHLKKDEANKKALRMINGSQQVILKGIVQEWGKMCLTKKAKEAGNAKAMRMINASGDALKTIVFKAWASDVSKNRERNKKMRAVEKTIGASADGLKQIVTQSWRNLTITNLRMKRSKSSGMSSSMKSIRTNEDMLYTHFFCTWARAIWMERVEKLAEAVKVAQAALDEAVAAAQAEVKCDVAKATKEVEKLQAELENVKAQHAAALLEVQALNDQVSDAEYTVQEKEKAIGETVMELDESRRKAKDIAEELSKVGLFLQNATPKKQPGSRPRSGTKGDADKLPKIGNGRPLSARGGSKGAVAP